MSKLKPPVNSKDHYEGSENAPMELVEYGDYQCPFCGTEFFAQTEPQIIQNYVNTGKVRFVESIHLEKGPDVKVRFS